MAAGDRNLKGRPTDIVRHLWATWQTGVKTECGRRNVGYASNDINDVTCLKCLKSISDEKPEPFLITKLLHIPEPYIDTTKPYFNYKKHKQTCDKKRKARKKK